MTSSGLPAPWLLIETGDGSPSLSYHQGEQSESMHHSGGAFAETRYIYEPLLLAGRGHFGKPSIVSVGLGLGYNEIFATQIYRQHSMKLVSFERDPWLRDEFAIWAKGENRGVLAPHYSKICALLEGGEKAAEVLRERIGAALTGGEIRLEGALERPEQIPSGTQLFLWDAFSRKTSPELWDESFLTACFNRAAEAAGLSTYAHSGNLKRALWAAGFTLEDRAGFSGKRSSTRAVRGDFRY